MPVFLGPNDLQPVEERLRAKLAEVQRRYKSERSHEAKADYLRTLRVFTDLVMYKKRPSDADLQ